MLFHYVYLNAFILLQWEWVFEPFHFRLRFSRNYNSDMTICLRHNIGSLQTFQKCRMLVRFQINNTEICWRCNSSVTISCNACVLSYISDNGLGNFQFICFRYEVIFLKTIRNTIMLMVRYHLLFCWFLYFDFGKLCAGYELSIFVPSYYWFWSSKDASFKYCRLTRENIDVFRFNHKTRWNSNRFLSFRNSFFACNNIVVVERSKDLFSIDFPIFFFNCHNH